MTKHIGTEHVYVWHESGVTISPMNGRLLAVLVTLSLLFVPNRAGAVGFSFEGSLLGQSLDIAVSLDGQLGYYPWRSEWNAYEEWDSSSSWFYITDLLPAASLVTGASQNLSVMDWNSGVAFRYTQRINYLDAQGNSGSQEFLIYDCGSTLGGCPQFQSVDFSDALGVQDGFYVGFVDRPSYYQGYGMFQLVTIDYSNWEGVTPPSMPNPVPEPSSLLLVIAGLFGLLLYVPRLSIR